MLTCAIQRFYCHQFSSVYNFINIELLYCAQYVMMWAAKIFLFLFFIQQPFFRNIHLNFLVQIRFDCCFMHICCWKNFVHNFDVQSSCHIFNSLVMVNVEVKWQTNTHQHKIWGKREAKIQKWTFASSKCWNAHGISTF